MKMYRYNDSIQELVSVLVWFGLIRGPVDGFIAQNVHTYLMSKNLFKFTKITFPADKNLFKVRTITLEQRER